MNDSKSAEHWYAFKILHNRVADVKARLADAGWNTYIPMKRVESTDIYYNTTVRHEPLIPSLIFARTTDLFACNVRRDNLFSASPYCKVGTCIPAAIPDKEMQNFMFVTTAGADKIVEYPHSLAKGDRVRITGGVFEGAEGIIKRVHHNMRFIVTVQGVAVLFDSYIPKKFIEKI